MNNFSIYLSLLICIAGLVLYMLATPEKPSKVGLVAYACGLLVFLFTFANKVVG